MQPTKPTSESWEGDALALLEMGAQQIDAATVRGLLDEMEKLRAVAKAAGEYLDTRCWDEDEDVIEEAGEALATAMNKWKGVV